MSTFTTTTLVAGTLGQRLLAAENGQAEANDRAPKGDDTPVLTEPRLPPFYHVAMGVPGLWKLLEPPSLCTQLWHVSAERCFDMDGKLRGYRLGVDASIWMTACTKKFLRGHARMGESPELKVLFHRLCRLAAMPVCAVFVFDGPDRPAVKRNTRVDTEDHYLTAPFKELIGALGFVCWEAPGEAEAELAAMNMAGFIHAVVTNDGDAFVFGALTIIREPPREYTLDTKGQKCLLKRKDDEVSVYTSSLISRDAMVLIAVLSGGDYSDGLEHCGPSTAFGLTKYGLGEDLVRLLRLSGDAQQAALAEWRASLREALRSDPQGHLGRRHLSLSTSIPAWFPDLAVVKAYAQPAVSDFTSRPVALYDLQERSPPINLRELVRICKEKFSFGKPAKLVPKFEKYVWPILVLRQAMCDVVRMQNPDSPGSTPSKKLSYTVKAPIAADRVHRRRRVILQDALHFAQACLAALPKRRLLPGVAAPKIKTSPVVHIPATIIDKLPETPSSTTLDRTRKPRKGRAAPRDAKAVAVSPAARSTTDASLARSPSNASPAGTWSAGPAGPSRIHARTASPWRSSSSDAMVVDLTSPSPEPERQPELDDMFVDLTVPSPIMVPVSLEGSIINLDL
ncbi:PIN domain-like protein [Phanerochaete sordida]|uniref:PIN domain-like protein n=1 Tax=Phanerochaete sordida TaxID=48140 RepID=A0A9P3G7I8_9APHY|nr:PIN domain-like protein [Phanerochaete sordida]